MVWSYSRVSAFDDCPYRWFLTYLYRDKNGNRIKKESSFFAEYGSYMHLILQMYLSGELNKKDLSTFYVRHFKENVSSKAPNQKIYHNYFRQGFDYFEDFAFPDRKILGVEKNVEFTFAGKDFTGYIDVVSSDDGKLIVTDHKSRTLKKRSKRSKPTMADKELDNYLRQLYLYSSAIKSEYGRFPDALEFNCFRSQDIIQEPFDIEKYHTTEKWAKTEIDRITRNNDWSPRPDYWKCSYLCDVCKECEYRA